MRRAKFHAIGSGGEQFYGLLGDFGGGSGEGKFLQQVIGDEGDENESI